MSGCNKYIRPTRFSPLCKRISMLKMRFVNTEHFFKSSNGRKARINDCDTKCHYSKDFALYCKDYLFKFLRAIDKRDQN